ncbi:MAG: hypothetical protein U0R65_02220 [Candidatus Nanopelagicales bacterium]
MNLTRMLGTGRSRCWTTRDWAGRPSSVLEAFAGLGLPRDDDAVLHRARHPARARAARRPHRVTATVAAEPFDVGATQRRILRTLSVSQVFSAAATAGAVPANSLIAASIVDSEAVAGLARPLAWSAQRCSRYRWPGPR